MAPKPELHVVSIVPGQGRPEPKALYKVEAAIWQEIVGAMPAHWFTPASQPLLRCLVRHIANAECIAPRLARARESTDWKALKELLKLYELETRNIASMSARLRLTPQARWSSERGTTQKDQVAVVRPWER
jgi:hypothetical protein